MNVKLDLLTHILCLIWIGQSHSSFSGRKIMKLIENDYFHDTVFHFKMLLRKIMSSNLVFC